MKLDKMNRSELHYAANNNDIESIKLCISKGENISCLDCNDWTPLHFAAQAQAVNAVKLLLESGAVVDAIDNNGNTALFKAVFTYRDDGTVIEILMQFGADPQKENFHGQSPIGLSKLISNYNSYQYFQKNKKTLISTSDNTVSPSLRDGDTRNVIGNL